MGQQQVNPQPHSARTYHYQSNKQVKSLIKFGQLKEHEGILKLRSTPFPNCTQISNDGLLLFLQNAQTTLFELMQSRLYTNRLFPLEDVQKLIQNVVYTLAFLAESKIIYKDLSTQNIYYCNGLFKLLPNELIQQKFYDKAWQNFYGLRNQEQEQDANFAYLSPELIIALRMKQKHVNDIQILNKSNVFIFGLILLQATTLLPSSQCFDSATYDIFNNVISERLELVQQHYNQCVARIIANMLDYDFNQRMDLKQLSIWINRQLTLERKQNSKSYDSADQKRSLNPVKSSLSVQKSRFLNIQQQKPIECNPIVHAQQPMPPKNYSRKNLVYINGYDDSGKQDSNSNEPVKAGKNYVYLESLPQYEIDYHLQKKIQQKNNLNHLDLRSKLTTYPSTQQFDFRKNSVDNSTKYNYQKEEKYIKNNKPLQSYAQFNYQQQPPALSYNKSIQKVGTTSSNPYLREMANLRPMVRQSESELKRTYQPTPSQVSRIQGATAKLRNQNKYYPSLADIQNQQRHSQVTKRIPKHSEINRASQVKQTFDSKQSKQSDSKCSMNDGSINRIKMEIQKSRKLIQEFRKCQGIEQ